VRILLFTGKGGVGKTTSAAATAALAARRGRSTLLVSADPAHSLADVTGVRLGADPTPVAENLWGLHLDAQRRFERSWEQLREYVTSLVRRGGLDEVAAGELVALPGITDLLALLEIRDRGRQGGFEAMVIDCAPTAETLRLCALPGALRWYIDRLFPSHRRLLRGVRALWGGEHASVLPSEKVLDALEELYTHLSEVQQLLTGSADASVRLVLTPESVVLAEARRTYTSLALYGFTVDAVLVNRVIPPGDDPWRAAWAAAQAPLVAEAEASFAPAPVYTAPYCATEPRGLEELMAFGAVLYGENDPLASAITAPSLRVTAGEVAGEHHLQLDLPLLDPAELGVARSAEELVVTAGGQRRLIALPESLRSCSVVGARLASGRLTVQFREGDSPLALTGRTAE
jgi:arsenite-transporting ATPase